MASALLRCSPAAQANISDKTIAVTAHHYDGTLEYNVHNLYGAYEVKATAEALRAIRNKRQFIFTRCGRRLARGWCVPDNTFSHHSPGDCLPLSTCLSAVWLDAKANGALFLWTEYASSLGHTLCSGLITQHVLYGRT